MKKLIYLVISLIMLVTLTCPAYAGNTIYGHVTCGTTAIKIWGGGEFISAVFQFQSGSVAVYLGPDSSVTSSNGPVMLSSTGSLSYAANTGDDAWYCVTGGSTAVIGYMIRLR